MAERSKGGFFDQTSISDDSEDVLAPDPSTLQIPEYEEEEEEEKPRRKPKVKEVEEETEEEEEDEEEETEEEEEESDEKPEDDFEDDLTDVNKVALSLIERGLLILDESKIKEDGTSSYSNSLNGIAEMVDDTLEARMKEKIAPGYESIIAAMEMGLPASEWLQAVAPEDDYENADTTDLDTQKILVSRKLEAEGLSKEKIQSKLTRLEKLDLLEDEAEEAQEFLIKKDKERIAESNKKIVDEQNKAKEAQKKVIDSINKEIDESNEILGFYVSKKEKKELKDYMTRPVNTKGQTQYMIDRNHPEKLVKAAYLLKNGVDSTKVTKVLKSAATKEVKDELSKRTDKGTSGKGRAARESTKVDRMSNAVPWGDTGPIEIED